MKQVLVSKLKIGDVFIDGDTYATVEDTTRIAIGDGYKYLRVKRIVGPTDKHLYLGDLYVPNYYIPIEKFVLLCERDDERDTS